MLVDHFLVTVACHSGNRELICGGVHMSQLTEIFLSLSHPRKVQLSARKVQLHFFTEKMQLKHFFVGDFFLCLN
jgi:hypothetical protein